MGSWAWRRSRPSETTARPGSAAAAARGTWSGCAALASRTRRGRTAAASRTWCGSRAVKSGTQPGCVVRDSTTWRRGCMATAGCGASRRCSCRCRRTPRAACRAWLRCPPVDIRALPGCTAAAGSRAAQGGAASQDRA
ncbi:hypothetical protein HJG60_012250 [Phyllostomus discolor]|uniref:Uncharacterized protein n=1 Tax=Phyllostomus discolor TaxID=89673 RepID=A0A833Z6C9_9CHIR|nr:hypothetical protein HJG60_012250 [Phyllostomus discolor]